MKYDVRCWVLQLPDTISSLSLGAIGIHPVELNTLKLKGDKYVLKILNEKSVYFDTKVLQYIFPIPLLKVTH